MIPLTHISTLFPYTTLFRSYVTSTNSFNIHPLFKKIIILLFYLLEDFICNKNRVKNSFFSLSSSSFILLLIGSFNKEKRSEEHTSELQSHSDLVCRLLLEKK